jgi:peptidoglycan/LPS O-acetylase OafA/YrhL
VTSTLLENRPAKAKSAPFHIPSLDGIRAISFLIVFLSHAGLKGKVPGYFGLSVFFFLSGYLITTLLRLEFDKHHDISLKQFYLRRVFRIFPPFYLVLLLAYLLTGLGAWQGTLGASAIVSQLCHFTNYYIIYNGWWQGLAPGTWVYWSLAVEEHFYLVFPLLYLVLRRLSLPANRQALILLALCALVLAWRCVLVFVLHAPKDRMYVATDTRIDSIVAGCLLAIWNNPVLDPKAPSDRVLGLVWLPIGVAMVLLSLVIRKPDFEQSFRYTLQSFGLLPVFVAAIRWHDHAPFSWLNTRLARYLGVLSYSMYLTHTMVLWGLEDRLHLPEALHALLGLAIVIGAADLIHRFVEKPFGRLRRRFGSAEA